MTEPITLNLYTDDVIQKLKTISTERLAAAVGALKVNITEEMAASRKGKTYTWRSVNGQWVKRDSPHTASAPGDYPAIDTGHLAKNIETDVEDYKARIGTNVPYGKELEFGTSKVEARPWLKRGMDDFKDEFINIMAKEIK